MKKNISWQMLIVIGLVSFLAGRFIISGIIGNAIGVFGDVCLLIGIVNAIVALIKKRREKKISIDSSKTESIGKSFVKKIEKRDIFIGLLIFIVVILGVVLFTKSKNQKETLESKLKNDSISDNISSKTDLNNIKVYRGEVLQVGGVGSRVNQKTVNNLEEDEYLNPPEDWITVSFNRPADIMDVDCVSEYKITSCKVNDKEIKIDELFGCRAMPLENKTQNKVEINCSKK